MESALHCRHAQSKSFRDFVAAQPLDVSKHEHLSLRLGKLRQGPLELVLNLESVTEVGRGTPSCPSPQNVERVMLGRLPHPAPVLTTERVSGDGEQPPTSRLRASERTRAAPGGDEALLECVLRIVRAGAKREKQSMDRLHLPIHQLRKRRTIAVRAPGKQLGVASSCRHAGTC